MVQGVDDPLIEPVELREPVGTKVAVSGDGVQQPGGERSVDAFKEFEEHEAQAVSLREEPILPGVRELLDQALRSEFGQLIAQGGEAVVILGATQGGGGVCVQFRGRERAARGDVGEVYQRMHQSQLPRVVQFQAGNAFAVWAEGGLAECPKLPPIDKGFEDVLLNIQVGVDNRGQLRPELGEIDDGLGHRVVRHVVGGRLGAEQEMIADVLFDESVAVVAANHRVGEVQVLDHRLQPPAISPRDLAAEDHRDLLRLADGAVGIQQPLAQGIEGGPPMEDQVVAILDLGKEQPVLAAGVDVLLLGEEWSEAGQPLLPAARQVACRQGVRQLLQPFRVPAFQEGVATLLEIDPLRPQLIRQPVVLVQTNAGGKGKVRAGAHEHPSPMSVVHVEVVLDDPALGELQVPAIVLRVPNRDHDPSRFSGLEDRDHLVGLSALEIRLDKLVSPAWGASMMGTSHCWDRFLTQPWNWSAMSRKTFRLTGYWSLLVLKNPITRSGCWKGWMRPLSRMRSKHRYPKRMLS